MIRLVYMLTRSNIKWCRSMTDNTLAPLIVHQFAGDASMPQAFYLQYNQIM